MANSAIQYENIDEEFPIAGQDNDSQGFRDNFSVIKTALETAKGEINQFLVNGARLDATNNDFNGNVISNAGLLQVSQKVYNTGNINSNTNIEWSDASFQNVTVTADVTLTLAGWPSSGDFGLMRLAIRSDGTSREINWVADNAGTIFKNSTWPGTFTVSSLTEPVLVDAWTTDGGVTVFLEYKGSYTAL